MPKKKKTVDVSKLRDIETYTHDDKKRANNPPAGMARHDQEQDRIKTYEYDPHIDPSLQWAGKAEGMTFDVPSSSIHVHESIKPHNIIKAVRAIGENEQDDTMTLFDEYQTPIERMRRRQTAIEFYRHGVDWTNRMIAGDSLIVMNSMLEKEGMAGQVQMAYIDPPYGIKYGSNFQPFVNKRDVKDKKDEDLTQEPEMIKAFRDTWELGIHSYLTYLRDRLLLVRELLADSGSVFVQISDENVHHVREICDEIFGKDNFFAQITFKKTLPLGSSGLTGICDYLICYAKNKEVMKYRNLFVDKLIGEGTGYTWLELKDGSRRKMTSEEKVSSKNWPDGAKAFFTSSLSSSGYTETCKFDFELDGKVYKCGKKSWRTNPAGMRRLIEERRIIAPGSLPCYVQYHSDFPMQTLNNMWDDTHGASDMMYVVQTSIKPIQRCLLMTTDPGDLVLDITCGSGTTAYVAEQWGRRWVTCDTSRVAIALAKKRLMTATFDYYQLAHPEQGVGSGFVYKTVPHITLKSIANDEPPAEEILYDQPLVDKTKVRVTGPFTIEALPAPNVRSMDDVEVNEDLTAKQDDWRERLRSSGINLPGNKKLEFSRVDILSGTKYLQAEAETKEDTPRRAVVCFADETKPLDARIVERAFVEVENMHPAPKILIFAAFQFDQEAAKMIDEARWPNLSVLKVQMNTDMLVEDLKKTTADAHAFTLVGQPDVELIKDGRSENLYKVRVNGFDYYNVETGEIISGGSNKIAMWMLDTNYDRMVVVPSQVFFPMDGKTEGWTKLAKTLKAEIDVDKIEKYAGTESLPFKAEPNTQIAVKIIDDRGVESIKVITIGEE